MYPHRVTLLLALALAGCNSDGPSDLDGDGYAAVEDCDDLDPSAHPEALEICDGVDNDCDGTVDVGALDAPRWYVDGDGDGWGDGASYSDACVAPAATVARSGDCDDARPEVHPGAPEVDCADPTDYNCDGSVGYVDADGDGHAACEECDDTQADTHPGAPERCDGADNDCDGRVDVDAIDADTWFADLDRDGHAGSVITVDACEAPAGYLEEADDCDDLDASTYPGAEELCDGADNDCDGGVDLGAVDAPTWYADADGDLFGDPDVATVACLAPAGAVADQGDCDDAAPAVHPGAPERCDGADDDCDGVVDEQPVDGRVWFPDGDGDGFGVSADAVMACAAPQGMAGQPGDCDDGEGARFPGNPEVCDTLDNDCDGAVDEDASDAPLWYRDLDRDGAAGDLVAERACVSPGPTGWMLVADDCDDLDQAVHLGADERCNGYDDDCDARIDEPDAVDASGWYQDHDGDGYGVDGSLTLGCEAPAGFVGAGGDCDDARAMVHPGRADLPGNGVDDDCDGGDQVALVCGADVNVVCYDERTGEEVWRLDVDEELYGLVVLADGRVWWSTKGEGETLIYGANVGDVAGRLLSVVAGDGDQLWWDPEREELLLAVQDGGVQVEGDGPGDRSGGAVVAVDVVSGRQEIVLEALGVPVPRMVIRLLGTEDYLVSTAFALVHYVAGEEPRIIELPSGFLEPAGPGAAWVTDEQGRLWRWETGVSELAPVQEALFGEEVRANGLCTSGIWPGRLVVADMDGGQLLEVWPEGAVWPLVRSEAEAWECDTNRLFDGDEDGVPGLGDGGADCDDTDPSVRPGGLPGCDDRDHDCDGAVDFDADGDGWSDAACGGSDADDADPSVRPVHGASCAAIVGTSADRGSGLYTIDPEGDGAGFEVYCDMETDGGGWTLLLRVSEFDDGIDFSHDGEGWSRSAPYGDVGTMDLTDLVGASDLISPAYAALGVSDLRVAESLSSPVHSVYTQDGFLRRRTLYGVLSLPIVDGGQACSGELVFPDGFVAPWTGYDALALAADEGAGDATPEPGRVAIRKGCDGDSEILQIGYTRVTQGDFEVYSQGDTWPSLDSAFILGR
ncbi:MAG: hypothetical protein JXX28_17310 [Deltaproteobacteria bacterium]|nr:hypothetical protein [Deltaproteobacteria bacterium]